MRIIAGSARGRRIEAPEGYETRPTSDRVRESLFSLIGARIELNGISVLDLYAGSGALGLEALSRGADHATFVEQLRERIGQWNGRHVARPQDDDRFRGPWAGRAVVRGEVILQILAADAFSHPGGHLE